MINEKHVDLLASPHNVEKNAQGREKKNEPSEIDDVEKLLKEKGKSLYRIAEKKDEKGNNALTRSGKNAHSFLPYRMGRLRVYISQEGEYRFQWRVKEQDCLWRYGISKRDYEKFISSKSADKRLAIFLKNNRMFVVRKTKNSVRLNIRLSAYDMELAKRNAKECGISVTELIRRRLHGMKLYQAFSAEEKECMKELLVMAQEYRKYGDALKNFLLTKGASGAQRLDAIFNSQPGTDYAKAMFATAQIIAAKYNRRKEG